jgi:large subunit ribosomal protein L29
MKMVEKKTTKKTTAKVAKDADLSVAAMESKLIDLKKEHMNQRFQHAVGQLPKTHVIRQTRREIARVKTKIAAAKK